MPAAETELHARLKILALAWARANGFPVAAAEVRVPKSGYRADVAAGGHDATARTAVFECKQARADLLKDAHEEAATRRRFAELTRRRARLEELLALHRPELRRGEAFWPEYDTWDFSALGHRGYRALLEELETVRRRLARGTKFSRMCRYRCADFLYLVVEEGIFAPAEIPAGWGLLVRTGDALQLARSPVTLASAAEQRAALLETIAFAGTPLADRPPRPGLPLFPQLAPRWLPRGKT